MDNPYKIFLDWLFDGNIKSELPYKDEFTSSSSPISYQFLLTMFLRHESILPFLNQHFNRYNVYYLPKEDMYMFIKKIIIETRFQRNRIPYFKKDKTKDDLADILRKKYPLLKKYDISQMCDLINSSEDKDYILSSYGLKTDHRKKKVSSSKKKAKETKNAEPTLDIQHEKVVETLSLQSLLNNFKIEKI